MANVEQHDEISELKEKMRNIEKQNTELMEKTFFLEGKMKNMEDVMGQIFTPQEY